MDPDIFFYASYFENHIVVLNCCWDFSVPAVKTVYVTVWKEQDSFCHDSVCHLLPDMNFWQKQ